MDNATAARRAGLRLSAGSGGAHCRISRARKGDSIIGTANENTNGDELA